MKICKKCRRDEDHEDVATYHVASFQPLRVMHHDCDDEPIAILDLCPCCFEDMFMNWNSLSNPPTETGWYAVLWMYESPEGLSDDGLFWNGETWSKDLPVGSWAGPFATQDLASDWAEQNNPDNYGLV